MTPPQVEYREIPLTQGQIAYVSPRKFEEIKAHKWCALWFPKLKNFYAVRNIRKANGKQTLVLMHRQILGLVHGDPREVDHADQTRTLDNTDENIRISNLSQQGHHQRKRSDNTSGYKGVRLNKKTGKWEARIIVDGKRRHLGSYNTAYEAHLAYVVAAVWFYRDFASY